MEQVNGETSLTSVSNKEDITQPSSSSLDKEMTESCSPVPIDSEILRLVDDAFGEDMRKSKSLKRVDSTPDPIPRYFIAGPKTHYIPEAVTHASSHDISTAEVKDNEDPTPSPLKSEESSKSISADDLAKKDDLDKEKEQSGNSSPPPERGSLESLGDKNKEGCQPNETVRSPNNGSSASIKPSEDEPLISSRFLKSKSDDLIVEIKEPQYAPSLTSSERSTASTPAMGNKCSNVIEEEVNKEGQQECIIPGKIEANSSKNSLRQIESFHRDFVGDLSLLSRTTYNKELADEKKTFPDPGVGDEDGLLGIGNGMRIADEQIKNCGEIPLEKDGGIPEEYSGFRIEWITGLVKEYMDSVEEEWQRRRSVWLEQQEINKHDPERKRKTNSVYKYESFRKYMANGNGKSRKIALQVPFTLPPIDENNGNPILKDERLPTRKDSSTEFILKRMKTLGTTSQIPKLNVVSGSAGSASNVELDDDVKSEDNPSTSELTLSATRIHSVGFDETDDDMTPSDFVDMTPFIDECGHLLVEFHRIHRENSNGEEKSTSSRSADEVLGIFMKKYKAFLDDEWRRRREIWIAKNTPDDNSVYQSYGSFQEALANQQIEPQFPYQLPAINAVKKVVPPPQNDVKQENITVPGEVETSKVPSTTKNENEDECKKEEEVPKPTCTTWWGSIFGNSAGAEGTLPNDTVKPAENVPVEETTRVESNSGLEDVAKNIENAPSTENADDTVVSRGESVLLKIAETITSPPVDSEVLHHQEISEGFDDLAKANECIQKMEEKIASVDIFPEPFVEIYRGLSREHTSSNLKAPAENPPAEYRAFVNGRTVICDSLEQKTRLDICCMKLNTVQTYAHNLRDMTTLPGEKILRYLSLQDYMNCRLVSRSWNNAVITHKKFLSKTAFVIEKKSLGALATLERSRVRWQHLRCSIIPAMNFTTSTSYNGRFLSTNLRVTPMSSRNEPVTHTLTSIIFENIDIHKQQLVQWIQNCKRLTSIEIRNCNFLRTTISMNMDKTNRVMERVQVLKFKDMDIAKLVEALRFFLPATRRLHTLEIIQKRDAKGSVKKTTLTTRKGAEDDVILVLGPALKKNAATLKNVHFEWSSVKKYLLQSKITEIFQDARFNLNRMTMQSFSPTKAEPCCKFDSYGSSSKNLIALLKGTLMNSKEMTLLDFPMLSLDFINGEDGAHLLSQKLEKLGVQLEMPEQETKINLGIRFPHLSQLDLYGRPLAHWFHVRETMPSLTQLVVYCAGMRDSQLQSIIRNLKLLQLLRLENVQGVTDFGITGMEQCWIERLKMYWPEKIDTNSLPHDQFPKEKIRFTGKSLSSLTDLHTFIMKGEFSLSNVGILYGFQSRLLKTLELHGSPVNASNSGLFTLSFQCPCLTRVQMTVRHSKASHLGIRSFHEGLENGSCGTYQIDLLPPAYPGPEENNSKHPSLLNY